MKTISEYREDIARLMTKATEIDTRCQGENRDLNEQEVAYKNELLDGVEELRKIVSTMERQERLAADLEKPAARKTVEGPKKETARIEVGEPQERFGSLGQQMAAIMRAGMPGGRVDPRLYRAFGMNETVPNEGGFLVQQDFTTMLYKDMMETGILASKCYSVPISGNANSIVINGIDETSRATTRHGGIQGYWIDEAGEKTKSKPKFRRIELNLKKLVGLCYATDELMEDANALESVIQKGFASEFGFQLDNAIINGTGAGQPLGILNSGSLVAVDKEAGQGAKTIMFENVVNMYSRLFATSRKNAIWFINQDVEPQLFQMSMAVGTGGVPVYMPAGGLSGVPYATLFGRPVIAIEQCKTLGTQGDIILADLSEGYILAQKGGIQSDMSIHVRFVYDESVFRFVLRVDGQPFRASALTPANGTATLSHFVALKTRS
jgi:HK97 family phage major capsid protein